MFFLSYSKTDGLDYQARSHQAATLAERDSQTPKPYGKAGCGDLNRLPTTFKSRVQDSVTDGKAG